MDKEFEKRYRHAVKAARLSDIAEPRGKSARYDKRSGRFVVELRNGATFIFPAELIEGLSTAANADLAKVELTPAGDGLRWDDLDVDLSLVGAVAGIFGGKRWMSELGRSGGRVRSTAKAEAARSNGLKGGRPRRKSA